MSEREAFLRAVYADPDDDAPRLALADWLDEHGDRLDRARAEFIRVQIELARLIRQADRVGFSRTWKRLYPLRNRNEKLWQRHGARWRAELPALAGIEWYETMWTRGFASYVRAQTLGDFLK